MVTTVTLSRNASLTTVGWRRFFFSALGFPLDFPEPYVVSLSAVQCGFVAKVTF